MSILPSFDSHTSSMEERTIEEVQSAGPPHEVLVLLLAYLPLYELLAMSEVCVSLRDAVNNGVLPWLNIIIERPLNSRLTDEILMKVASKAHGRLRTLALINCVRITNDGLQRVVDQNPLINKLHIPGCTGLTPEGVIRAVKTLSEHHRSLKSLRIRGIYNVNKEHLETLHRCLSMNPEQQDQKKRQPILYHCYRNHATCGHEIYHTIDLEICPICDEVKMVFDCSRKACKRKKGIRPKANCRGCCICIPRCEECGGCVADEELEEAACADILCSSCWLQLPKCDFCNKPYCKQHTSLRYCSRDSAGFICDVCHAESEGNLCTDME